MGIFNRKNKKAGKKNSIKRGKDARSYTKAGTLLGMDLQQEVTNERDKLRYGKER